MLKRYFLEWFNVQRQCKIVEKVGRDDASLQSKYFLLLSNEKSFQKLKTENKRKNVKV
jgi:hypothetical protein